MTGSVKLGYLEWGNDHPDELEALAFRFIGDCVLEIEQGTGWSVFAKRDDSKDSVWIRTAGWGEPIFLQSVRPVDRNVGEPLLIRAQRSDGFWSEERAEVGSPIISIGVLDIYRDSHEEPIFTHHPDSNHFRSTRHGLNYDWVTFGMQSYFQQVAHDLKSSVVFIPGDRGRLSALAR